ncbi:MAG: hypothetical protein COW00_08135 [Bdellovibrio sp. CG12_big_fil_rev_8_21_14_0_65_39_13]|nr:MAG: hypothetical protein COW78_11710 [Bdellovibrio sp. CG22_combo_CG10-13_8_21_14_all_39_27]PIQ60012.1 MAG: hypothetical protein COW00_08135 [Bdellovibrio sp. CG12_big_fil_rev_8_21_14_0_65_39_13]PIR35271.1 MAG: hypothetical protein COV37_09245 [Bdellovibrio sp. CG11_big_fil_rev_8_21_14_0_20_39_38]PJB53007.1 MAG: hypothetical protein CO099_09525 [Bdellovibrio sp. CG_4_9_14_3_um_filter_39_7]
MVKIRDLTEPQLEQQIRKYQKLLDELIKERNRRAVGTNPNMPVDTNAELATSEINDPFQLNFDDKEIAKLQEDASENEKKKDMAEEEVRVTQLLQLNKGQLAELQKNAEKLRAQELKKKASVVKKAPVKK